MPLVGENGNNLAPLTRRRPPNASEALNEPNTLVRLLTDADANSNVTVLGNGNVRMTITNDQRPDNRSFENRNNRTAIYFNSPWPWEYPQKYRMTMWVQDGQGVRFAMYEPPAEVVAELENQARPPSGTWGLIDAHLNGTWMDPEAPFPSIPAALDLQWMPVLERRSPRHRKPPGHVSAAGVIDPLIENGVIIEDGLVEITFSTPIEFATHADETRFFNQRARVRDSKWVAGADGHVARRVPGWDEPDRCRGERCVVQQGGRYFDDESDAGGRVLCFGVQASPAESPGTGGFWG